MSRASLKHFQPDPASFSDAKGLTKEDDADQSIQDDYLGGITEIAQFLGWNPRRVRYARETGALPIRVKNGVGLYAFKSEILAALKTPDTLAPKSSLKAH